MWGGGKSSASSSRAAPCRLGEGGQDDPRLSGCFGTVEERKLVRGYDLMAAEGRGRNPYFLGDHEQKLGGEVEEACARLVRAGELTWEGVETMSDVPPAHGRDYLVHPCKIRDGAGGWVVGKKKKGWGEGCRLGRFRGWEEWRGAHRESGQERRMEVPDCQLC